MRDKGWYRVTLQLHLMQGNIAIKQDWADDLVSDRIASGGLREDLVLAMTTSIISPTPVLANM